MHRIDEDELDAFLWEVDKVSKGVSAFTNMFIYLGEGYNRRSSGRAANSRERKNHSREERKRRKTKILQRRRETKSSRRETERRRKRERREGRLLENL